MRGGALRTVSSTNLQHCIFQSLGENNVTHSVTSQSVRLGHCEYVDYVGATRREVPRVVVDKMFVRLVCNQPNSLLKAYVGEFLDEFLIGNGA